MQWFHFTVELISLRWETLRHAREYKPRENLMRAGGGGGT